MCVYVLCIEYIVMLRTMADFTPTDINFSRLQYEMGHSTYDCKSSLTGPWEMW